MRRLGDRERATSIVNAAIAMALERGDTWWLPALYLRQSELDPASAGEATPRHALTLARAPNSLGLERRILAFRLPARSASQCGALDSRETAGEAERFRERFGNSGLHRLSCEEESL